MKFEDYELSSKLSLNVPNTTMEFLATTAGDSFVCVCVCVCVCARMRVRVLVWYKCARVRLC